MSCEYTPEQLYLFLDGELNASEAQEVAHHLTTCVACQQAVAAHQRLQVLLRQALEEEDVPAQLWRDVQRRLAQEATPAVRAPHRLTRPRVWIGCGAVAVLLLLVWLGRLWLMPPLPTVAQAMVDSHIRTRLMAAPYTQIAASPEAVRAWFHDKVEFAVPVLRLSPERYNWLGVRLNYFLNRRVAELAYATDTHVLSLFMLTEPRWSLQAASTVQVGSKTVAVHQQKGYTAVLWQDGDLVCGLVSDLSSTALISLLQEAFSGHTAS